MVKALAWVGLLILQILVPWQLLAWAGGSIMIMARAPHDRVGLCRNCGESPEAGNGLCVTCDKIRKDAEDDRCDSSNDEG